MMAIVNMADSIYDTAAEFEVKCKRCGKVFVVIRNAGGGIRRSDNERSNPATCSCGSMQLEVY